VLSRIPESGQILGWRGFHTDLDTAKDAIERLELGVRGIFKSDDESLPSEGSDS
jgi:hypothetical protein